MPRETGVDGAVVRSGCRPVVGPHPGSWFPSGFSSEPIRTWPRACSCTLGQTPFFRCLFPACEVGPGIPTLGLGPAVGRDGGGVTS